MEQEKETTAIINACMNVHNELGSGFLESVYQEALAIEFKSQNIPFEKEKRLRVVYKGHVLEKDYYADFICYGNIIVELKAVATLLNAHKAQVINYLKASNNETGLLINFGSASLKWIRLTNLKKVNKQFGIEINF